MFWGAGNLLKLFSGRYLHFVIRNYQCQPWLAQNLMPHIYVNNDLKHQIPSLKPLNVWVKQYIHMPKYAFQLNLNVNSEKTWDKLCKFSLPLSIPLPACFGQNAILLLVYLISQVLMAQESQYWSLNICFGDQGI